MLLAFGLCSLAPAPVRAQTPSKPPALNPEPAKKGGEKTAPASNGDKPGNGKKTAGPAAPPAPAPAPAAPIDAGPNPMRAYEAALAKRRLAATAPLSRQRLRDDLVGIEEKLVDGRRDEAIFDLVYIVES